MNTYCRISFLLPLLAAGLLLGCGLPADRYEPVRANSIADDQYLTSPFWNDGEAEVAFYRVHRTRNQYGEPEDQSFLVGSYLVKHDYDPSTESKAEAEATGTVSAFKYALFYEFESGSYEYKRSHVVNARQADLRPLKASFTSFDWCSNQYREQTFEPGGRVRYLMRSDDYGNRASTYTADAETYPVSLIPMVMRGLDFEDEPRRRLAVLLDSGDIVPATAERQSIDTLDTEAGTLEAERIVLTYEGAVPSPFAEEADASEVYWRATDEARRLLAVQGESGRYSVELVESVRSPYWSANVYDELERVTARP